jgi:hypothetical protein
MGGRKMFWIDKNEPEPEVYKLIRIENALVSIMKSILYFGSWQQGTGPSFLSKELKEDLKEQIVKIEKGI